MSELFEHAQQALHHGDLHKAADLCKQLLASDPQNPQGYFLMSSLFSATGNHQKASDFSALAISLDATVAQFHLQQGHVLYTLREYQPALEAFCQASSLMVGNPEPALWVANCLAALGRLPEADSWFSRARACGDDWQSDAYEGRAHMRLGNFSKAETFFDRIIKQFPQCEEGYVLRAQLFCKMRDYAQAKWLLRKALLINPTHADALYWLALLLAEEGQEKPALQAVMQVVQQQPARVECLLMMGYLLERLGDLAATEKAFLHAFAIAPGHALARYEIIFFLLQRGREAEALALAEKYPPDSRYVEADAFVRGLTRSEMPCAIPDSMLAMSNNAYAESFEPWLASERAGIMQKIVANELLGWFETHQQKHISLLDLGCGAGLLSEYLRPQVAISVGVDVADGLLAVAKHHANYDVCFDMDLVEYLQNSEAQFDVVACSSALKRIHNLQPVFQAARGVMHSASIFAFSVVKEHSSLAYTLQPSGSYSHNGNYVCDVAESEGFVLQHHREYMVPKQRELLAMHHMFIFKKATVH